MMILVYFLTLIALICVSVVIVSVIYDVWKFYAYTNLTFTIFVGLTGVMLWVFYLFNVIKWFG